MRHDTSLLIVFFDVAGHGPRAAAVGREIEQWLRSHADLDPAAILERLNEKLRGKRNAVVLACRFAPAARTMTWAGIGNLTFLQVSPEKMFLQPQEGIVGYVAPKPKTFEADLQGGEVFVMHSDGVASRAADVAGQVRGDARTIAERVLAECARDTDDASVVVVTVT